MKKSNPILNVLTAILASVGGCTAVLSCFIIFHAVFIGEFGVPDNKSATRETALIQSGSIPQETASIQSSSLPEGFSLPLLLPEEIPSMAASAGIDTADDEDHAGSQSVEAYQAETEVDSIPLKYYQALNRANAYSDTMHMPKADIYEQLVSAYGDYFPADAAQYAVDHLTNVWEPEEPEPVPAAQDSAEMASSDMTGQAVPVAGRRAGHRHGRKRQCFAAGNSVGRRDSRGRQPFAAGSRAGHHDSRKKQRPAVGGIRQCRRTVCSGAGSFSACRYFGVAFSDRRKIPSYQ